MTGQVHLLAGESQFLSHLVPIWQALPEENRGGIYAGDDRPRRGPVCWEATQLSIEVERLPWPPTSPNDVTVVSAVGDLHRLLRWRPGARVAFAEHGCGMTYASAGPSFVGSAERPNVELIFVPSERLAELQHRATPGIAVVSLGDSPKLDQYRNGWWRTHWNSLGPEGRRIDQCPTICLTWHWDSPAFPETRSAFYWYRAHLPHLVASRPDLRFVAHAHPRVAGHVKSIVERSGIPFIIRFDEVINTADVLAVDNSSVLYEWASLDWPCVVMNCPRYRRDVLHGLRFWDHVPGPQVDDPHHLGDALDEALADAPPWPEKRRAAADYVYSLRDGRAAERAAQALLCLL